MLELIPDFNEFPSGARFNSLGNRRHILWRVWNTLQPKILLVGINPSTADENKNDPTISRVVKILKSWDYGGFIICNLSSKISSDPKKIRDHDMINPVDDKYINKAIEMVDITIFMWGNEGAKYMPRIESFKSIIPVAYCFGQNQNGHPRHPLYIPESGLQLKPFNWNKI